MGRKAKYTKIFSSSFIAQNLTKENMFTQEILSLQIDLSPPRTTSAAENLTRSLDRCPQSQDFPSRCGSSNVFVKTDNGPFAPPPKSVYEPFEESKLLAKRRRTERP